MALFTGLQRLNKPTGKQSYGIGVWTKAVQTGAGANPITVVTPFKKLTGSVAVIDATAPFGAAAATVATHVAANGRDILLERYQADASATPAWIDSTTDILVTIIAVGEY